MDKFKPGDYVEMDAPRLHMNYPENFPEEGIVGVVIRRTNKLDNEEIYRVQWPAGSTSGNDSWLARGSKLKLFAEGD